MPNSAVFKAFLAKHWSLIALFVALFFVVAVSLPVLTVKPRIWVDEAKSIELARNFADFRRLDIQTAPGVFSGIPHLLQSTGYPLTVPLALFFQLFGFSFTGARMFMLALMLVALCVTYFVMAKLFSPHEAAIAVLLVASFASFHDNGRTVVGEIPGFIFLFLALYTWIDKRAYLYSGLLTGLAVVVKPSVYTWALPAFLGLLIIEGRPFMRKAFRFFIGLFIPAFLWIAIVFGSSLHLSDLKDIGRLYENPYSAPSISSNILKNIELLLTSSTIIYFFVLLGVLIVVRRFISREKTAVSHFVAFTNFVFIYSACAFIYFLRSPGWIRYLIAAELFILCLIPVAFRMLEHKEFKFFMSRPRSLFKLLILAPFLLVLIQGIHFFTSAQIYSGTAALETVNFIETKFPDAIVSVVNSLPVAALLPHEHLFQVVEMLGIPRIGTHSFGSERPVTINSLPDLVVANKEEKIFLEKKTAYEAHYNPVAAFDGITVFTRRGL